MKCKSLCIAALLLVVLSPPILSAQGYRDFHPLALDTRENELFSLSGRVVDKFNKVAVPGAIVRLNGVGIIHRIDTTDAAGFYRFTDLDPDDFPFNHSTISVIHEGYWVLNLVELGSACPAPIELSSRTVVLVHGIVGTYEGTWGGDDGVFASVLRGEGFRVVGFDAGGFPDNSRPISFALEKLIDTLDNNCHQIGIQSYDVIGHSMGGLVARSYAVKEGGINRINKLVTLGTPHHGANIANVLFRPVELVSQGINILMAEVFRWFSGGTCCGNDIEILPEETALRDLRIGSEYLNSLNKNKKQSSFFWNNLCRRNFSELTNHHKTTLYSIAGTQPSGIYSKAENFVGCNYRGLYPTSDGIVLKPRAYYHNSNRCTDVGLGCPGTHHKERSGGIARSSCIADKVANLLKNDIFDCSSRDGRDEEGFIPSQLPLIEGIVLPDNTYEASTLISTASIVNFLCISAADSLVYTLESPSGRIIDPDECEFDPNLEYIRDFNSAYYSILNPETGLWKHFVTCLNSIEPEHIMIFTTFDGDVALSAETATGIDPDDVFTLYVSFTDAGYSIPTGVVTATVTRPDGTTDQIELFDDGFGDDEIAGDGIYTATYPAGGEVGTFSFVILGNTDPGGSQSELRETFLVTTAAWLPDPAIVEPGLEVSETEVPFGGLIDLSASFTNLGTATADSVLITLSNVNYSVALAETLLVGMAPGQTITLQAEWLAVAEGEFTLRAGIDLIGEQIESNLSNNGAEVVVTVSIPGDVTSVPDDGAGDGSGGDPATGTSRILLYPNFPNPLASGSTSIRFQVPQAGAQTELAVFDIRGRRVKTLVSEALPQGEHARAWDGSDHSGRQVASGVYFYRLQVAGEVQIKKMVVVR